MKKTYHYYIVYYSSAMTGACTLDLDKPLNTGARVNEINKYISENKCDGKPALMLNWIRLKG